MTLNIPGALFRQNDVRETQTDESITLGIATQIIGGCTGERFLNNGETSFYPIFGGFAALEFNLPNEEEANIIIPKTGTIKNLYNYIESNTIIAITSAEIIIRKNGSDTDLKTSYGSTETGTQSNTTDEVSVTAGDLIAIKIATQADGANGIKQISWGLEFTQV